MTSEVAQKHVDINVDDDCEDSVHPKTDDLLCDKEVSVILEKGLITEVEETTNQGVIWCKYLFELWACASA